MKIYLAFLITILALTACVELKPRSVRVDSDPNVQNAENRREKIEESSIDAFISEHPGLDAQTKKDLKDGTISRPAALEKLKQHPAN